SMLLIILVIWPVPTSPTWSTSRPNVSSTGRAAVQPALLAADIDRAGAVVGGLLAEHDRSIQHADVLCRGQRGEPPAGVRRHRACEADHGAWRQRVEQAGAFDDIVHLLIGRHHDDDDFGVLADLGDGAAVPDTVVRGAADGVGVDVVARDIEAFALHVA